MKANRKLDVYEMVNEKILKLMESGNFSWSKTWKGRPGEIAADWNYNLVSKKPYSFLNHIMLESDRKSAGFTSNFWLTFNQIRQLGGNCAGQKSNSFVVFFTMIELDEIDIKTGKNKIIPYLKYSRVFNLDQVSGISAEKIPATGEKIVYAETDADNLINFYLDKTGIKTRFGGDHACYSPSLDRIMMPTKESFTTPDNFYATYFHEMTHSTGHVKRLERFTGIAAAAAFGSEEYSKEELVAEMGSSYLCSIFGFLDTTIENSVAYLQSWSKKLQENKKWLVSAFGKAEKAVDYILSGFDFPENTPDDDKPTRRPGCNCEECDYQHDRVCPSPCPGSETNNNSLEPITASDNPVKSKKRKYTKKDIFIPGLELTLPAYCTGNLCYHRSPEFKGWGVSHIKTGSLIIKVRTSVICKQCIDDLLQIYDFGFNTIVEFQTAARPYINQIYAFLSKYNNR